MRPIQCIPLFLLHSTVWLYTYCSGENQGQMPPGQAAKRDTNGSNKIFICNAMQASALNPLLGPWCLTKIHVTLNVVHAPPLLQAVPQTPLTSRHEHGQCCSLHCNVQPGVLSYGVPGSVVYRQVYTAVTPAPHTCASIIICCTMPRHGRQQQPFQHCQPAPQHPEVLILNTMGLEHHSVQHGAHALDDVG